MLTVLHAPAEVKASGLRVTRLGAFNALMSALGHQGPVRGLALGDEIEERLRYPTADIREVPLWVGYGPLLRGDERRLDE